MNRIALFSRFVRFLVGICLAATVFVGCQSEIRSIPPGYVGLVLTPTGWQKNIQEAGQVDLGVKSPDGSFNRLVLLEATSVTVKEAFLKTGADNEDHRILTKNGIPLTVDLRVRLMLPEDAKARIRIFALMTPKTGEDKDERVMTIRLEDVYNQFAQMEIRGKARAIFARYQDDKEVYGKYDVISDEIAKMVKDTFDQQGVPLRIQSVQLSNVKVDDDVLRAGNNQLAATSQVDTIKAVGTALRENPEYLKFMQWESLKEMAKTGNVTVVVSECPQSGGNPVMINTGKEVAKK